MDIRIFKTIEDYGMIFVKSTELNETGSQVSHTG